jgi:hypothetical protein
MAEPGGIPPGLHKAAKWTALAGGLLLVAFWVTTVHLGGEPNPRLALLNYWVGAAGLLLLLVALVLTTIGGRGRPIRH